MCGLLPCGFATGHGTVRDGVLTRMTLEEDLLFEAYGRVENVYSVEACPRTHDMFSSLRVM